jgi:hypothetical protein
MSLFNDINNVESVIALSYIDTFTTGSNKPLLVRCLNPETNERKDCVLKSMGTERMSADSSARELLSTFIAWEWGISIVNPVIIEITQAFLNTLNHKPIFSNPSKSLGYNYGSIYLKNFHEPSILYKLNEIEIEQGLLIFAFDIFIGNADRRLEKPNCFTDGQNLVIFDHELAFGYVDDIIQNTEPWTIRESDNYWINKLYLKKKLKGQKIPKENILKCIEKIDDLFWEKAISLIPNNWKTDKLMQIRNYVSKIAENRVKFVDNLKYLLV